MKEENIRIKLADGKIMYGILRGSLSRPVILMIHGLTGQNNEYIFYNGARFFDRYGFTTLRVDLYTDGKDARSLTDVHTSNTRIRCELSPTVLATERRQKNFCSWSQLWRPIGHVGRSNAH